MKIAFSHVRRRRRAQESPYPIHVRKLGLWAQAAGLPERLWRTRGSSS